MDVVVSKFPNVREVAAKGEVIDPAFFVAGKDKNIYPDHVFFDYLSHNITRNTHDLRSHVDKAYLSIKKKHPEALYSALVDLFLVLGTNNGLALRKRMLASARNLLSESQFTLLKESISLGLGLEASSLATRSLLRKGLAEKHRDFIKQNKLDNRAEFTPLEEAREYIQNGQLEQAQLTLQQAIIATPEHMELHDHLLEIYDRTDDKEQFLSFYKELDEHSIILPEIWNAVLHRFGIGKQKR